MRVHAPKFVRGFWVVEAGARAYTCRNEKAANRRCQELIRQGYTLVA